MGVTYVMVDDDTRTVLHTGLSLAEAGHAIVRLQDENDGAEPEKISDSAAEQVAIDAGGEIILRQPDRPWRERRIYIYSAAEWAAGCAEIEGDAA